MRIAPGPDPELAHPLPEGHLPPLQRLPPRGLRLAEEVGTARADDQVEGQTGTVGPGGGGDGAVAGTELKFPGSKGTMQGNIIRNIKTFFSSFILLV